MWSFCFVSKKKKPDKEIPANRADLATRFLPGESGNPTGRPKTARFLRALERVMDAKKSIGKGEEIIEIDSLLKSLNTKARELVENCKTTQEFIQIMPYLVQLHDWLDGAASVVELSVSQAAASTDDPKAIAGAKATSNVYIVGPNAPGLPGGNVITQRDENGKTDRQS
jgi:hypothetical protein